MKKRHIKLFEDFTEKAEGLGLYDKLSDYIIKAQELTGLEFADSMEALDKLREIGSEDALELINSIEAIDDEIDSTDAEELFRMEEEEEEGEVYEAFTTLSDEQKIKLHTVIDNIIDGSMEKVDTNSEVANPKGRARNPFYDRGSRQLQGLGKPFGNLVPGSVEKEKGTITADVSHGVEYESGLKREYKSQIKMDEKTLEYTIKKLSSDL